MKTLKTSVFAICALLLSSVYLVAHAGNKVFAPLNVTVTNLTNEKWNAVSGQNNGKSRATMIPATAKRYVAYFRVEPTGDIQQLNVYVGEDKGGGAACAVVIKAKASPYGDTGRGAVFRCVDCEKLGEPYAPYINVNRTSKDIQCTTTLTIKKNGYGENRDLAVVDITLQNNSAAVKSKTKEPKVAKPKKSSTD